MRTISQTNFAKKIGVSKARINRLVKDGFFAGALVTIPGRKIPQLDEAKAFELLRGSLDPAKQTASGFDKREYIEAKTAAEHFRAQLAKQKFERTLDRYIKADYVAAQVPKVKAILHRRLMALPEKISGQLTKEKDPTKCLKIMDSAIKDALLEIIADIKRADI